MRAPYKVGCSLFRDVGLIAVGAVLPAKPVVKNGIESGEGLQRMSYDRIVGIVKSKSKFTRGTDIQVVRIADGARTWT
jgi:hypothetical protein